MSELSVPVNRDLRTALTEAGLPTDVADFAASTGTAQECEGCHRVLAETGWLFRFATSHTACHPCLWEAPSGIATTLLRCAACGGQITPGEAIAGREPAWPLHVCCRAIALETYETEERA